MSSIQSWGSLFIITSKRRLIAAVSENAERELGLPLASCVGRAFEDFLVPADRDSFNAMLGEASIHRQPARLPVAFERTAYQARIGAFIEDDLYVVEALPNAAPLSSDGWAKHLPVLEGGLHRLQVARSRDEVIQAALEALLKASPFERFVWYDFTDLQIQISQEVRRSGETILGLSVPHSDFPPRVNTALQSVQIRFIPDYEAVNYPLVARDGREFSFDVTRSLLASIENPHVRRLRSLGVRSSLAMPVLVKGQIVGLIAGNKATPLRSADPLPSGLETYVTIVRDLVSQRLSILAEDAKQQVQQKFDRLARSFEREMGRDLGKLGQWLTREHAAVLEAFTAQGLAVLHRNRWSQLGDQVPVTYLTQVYDTPSVSGQWRSQDPRVQSFAWIKVGPSDTPGASLVIRRVLTTPDTAFAWPPEVLAGAKQLGDLLRVRATNDALIRAKAKADKLQTHDPDTGLFCRSAFLDHFSRRMLLTRSAARMFGVCLYLPILSNPSSSSRTRARVSALAAAALRDAIKGFVGCRLSEDLLVWVGAVTSQDVFRELIDRALQQLRTTHAAHETEANIGLIGCSHGAIPAHEAEARDAIDRLSAAATFAPCDVGSPSVDIAAFGESASIADLALQRWLAEPISNALTISAVPIRSATLHAEVVGYGLEPRLTLARDAALVGGALHRMCQALGKAAVRQFDKYLTSRLGPLLRRLIETGEVKPGLPIVWRTAAPSLDADRLAQIHSVKANLAETKGLSLLISEPEVNELLQRPAICQQLRDVGVGLEVEDSDMGLTLQAILTSKEGVALLKGVRVPPSVLGTLSAKRPSSRALERFRDIRSEHATADVRWVATGVDSPEHLLIALDAGFTHVVGEDLSSLVKVGTSQRWPGS